MASGQSILVGSETRTALEDLRNGSGCPGLLGRLQSQTLKQMPYKPMIEQPAVSSSHEDRLSEILTCFRRHALLVWVALPAFVALQVVVQPWQPACATGYGNWTLLVVAMIIAHYMYAEACAWAGVKALMTPPELGVLRQLGVLAKRLWMVLLGLLEDLNLYTDLTFPLIARSCDITITDVWLQEWKSVPIIGGLVSAVVQKLRFWGCSAVFAAAVVFLGLAEVRRFFMQTLATESSCEPGCLELGSESSIESRRLSGENLFALARFAEAAAMPSVAQLCEEAGLQKRWVFSSKNLHGGALGAAKAREDVAFGKMPQDSLKQYELYNEDRQQSVESAGHAHFMVQLLCKVFLANAAQLWLQASFFELSFGWVGQQAMYKLMAGMAISGLQICVRSSSASASKSGDLGCVFALLSLLVFAWAGAKIYYAFACDDHIWNLSTGCVVKVDAHEHSS